MWWVDFGSTPAQEHVARGKGKSGGNSSGLKTLSPAAPDLFHINLRSLSAANRTSDAQVRAGEVNARRSPRTHGRKVEVPAKEPSTELEQENAQLRDQLAQAHAEIRAADVRA